MSARRILIYCKAASLGGSAFDNYQVQFTPPIISTLFITLANLTHRSGIVHSQSGL